VGDGKAGSEQQVNGTTVRIIKAADANQGVAVDANYFYTIDNYSITKHSKNSTNGTDAILQWYRGANGPIFILTVASSSTGRSTARIRTTQLRQRPVR
jgi:hypothetical protein